MSRATYLLSRHAKSLRGCACSLPCPLTPLLQTASTPPPAATPLPSCPATHLPPLRSARQLRRSGHVFVFGHQLTVVPSDQVTKPSVRLDHEPRDSPRVPQRFLDVSREDRDPYASADVQQILIPTAVMERERAHQQIESWKAVCRVRGDCSLSHGGVCTAAHLTLPLPPAPQPLLTRALRVVLLCDTCLVS